MLCTNIRNRWAHRYKAGGGIQAECTGWTCFFFFKCVLNHVKITFAAGQKHPVFTIYSCRSEIKTSDLWDYCVTEHGTTGTNVPEHSRCLSKSADLHHWIIPHKNMRISSTCEGDLNDQLWIEKCFVFYWVLGFFCDQINDQKHDLSCRFVSFLIIQ